MKIVLAALAALVTVAGFMPLLRYEAWWVRVFDFPRGQVFGLGVLVLVAFVWLYDLPTWPGMLLGGLMVVSLVLQAVRIFPYTPVAPREVKAAGEAGPEASLSLMVANVLMSNREADRLLALVETWDPDIVLTLEPDAWWAERLERLKETHPYTIEQPLDNRYGMLLHSRLELVDPEVRYLIRDDIPSMRMLVRLRSGHLVRLYGLHPEPPSPVEAETSTERDAELLLVGREVEGLGGPTIVAGDLNDVAWSYTTTLFQRISGMLDPRKGRGMFSTYHADLPFLRWPLDHIFHTEHFTLADIDRLPAWGSDHLPVYVRLVFDPAAGVLQKAPEADREDREEAEEKIEKAAEEQAERQQDAATP